MFAALAIIGGVYLLTLQRTVVGICPVDYCADTGEFQVALPLWGTVHYTGYPLYMLLGSPFVTVLRWVGIQPAAGASLYSFLWEMLALALLMLLIGRLTGNFWLAAAIGLAVAFIEPIWVHGVIPEVYSLAMVLSVAILWVAVGLRKEWSDGRGWLLAFLCGLGVAHHRLFIFLIFWVAIYVFPAALRSRSLGRWLAIAVLCGAAGFLPYADLLRRILAGSAWTYQGAHTWQDFLKTFNATEVRQEHGPLTLNLTAPGLVAAAKNAAGVAMADLTWPGLALAGVAVALGLWMRKSRWTVAWLAALLLSYFLFPVVVPDIDLTHPALMFGYLALALILAFSLGSLRRSRQMIAALLCVSWAAWLGFHHWPVVHDLTSNRSGLAFIAQVEHADAPSGSVVMAPWGSGYFILSYAHLVEGRMPDWQVVDNRADFEKLTSGMARPIYTHTSTLYQFGVDWWAKRIPQPLRIASAGPNMVMLTASPPGRDDRAGNALGDGIELRNWAVRDLGDGQTQVTLWWAARRAPSASYSSYVHASDQAAVSRPEDIVAMSDYAVPVYGHVPTTDWQPGEVVREDHVLDLPAGRELHSLIVGMYRQVADGGFDQLGAVTLHRQGNEWVR